MGKKNASKEFLAKVKKNNKKNRIKENSYLNSALKPTHLKSSVEENFYKNSLNKTNKWRGQKQKLLDINPDVAKEDVKQEDETNETELSQKLENDHSEKERDNATQFDFDIQTIKNESDSFWNTWIFIEDAKIIDENWFKYIFELLKIENQKAFCSFPPWIVNQEHSYSTPREYYNCEYEAAKVFNWYWSKLSNYSIDIYSLDEIDESPTDFEETNINDIKIDENLNINSEFLNKYLDFWKAKLDKELENGCYILNTKLWQKIKSLAGFCWKYFSNWISMIIKTVWSDKSLEKNGVIALCKYLDHLRKNWNRF